MRAGRQELLGWPCQGSRVKRKQQEQASHTICGEKLNETSKEGWIERRPDQELMDVGSRVSQLNQSNAKRVAARQATVARDLWLAPAMALAPFGKKTIRVHRQTPRRLLYYTQGVEGFESVRGNFFLFLFFFKRKGKKEPGRTKSSSWEKNPHLVLQPSDFVF
jgi:hypothetical protein